MDLNREISQQKKKIKEFQQEEEKLKATIAQCNRNDTQENIVEKVGNIVEKKMEKLSKSVMKSFADSLKETLISEVKKNRVNVMFLYVPYVSSVCFDM